MDLRSLLFDVGDRVSGWSEIRHDEGGVWSDPPHPVSLTGMPRGRRHPRSVHAVRLLDADPLVVATELNEDGPSRWATVQAFGWAMPFRSLPDIHAADDSAAYIQAAAGHTAVSAARPGLAARFARRVVRNRHARLAGRGQLPQHGDVSAAPG